MTLLVPNSAEVIIMANLLNIAAPEDLKLKLFSSNTTPAESDTEANYTETTGGGYTDVTLTPANWTTTPGDATVAAYPEHVFDFDGADAATVGDVYGYYVVQATSGALLWAEVFSGAPLSIQNIGDEIRVTLQITLE